MFLFGADLNLIWAVLAFFSLAMIVFGGLINYLETFVPCFLNDAFRYGKTSRNQSGSGNLLVRSMEVPKHYFLHFYAFASVYTPVVWGIMVCVYFLEIPVPDSVMDFLDFVGSTNRRNSTTSEGAFLALTLLNIQVRTLPEIATFQVQEISHFNPQVFRRLYECSFVNVRSGARMNLLHYIVGFVHYFCAAAGIVCEAPGFTREFDVHADIKGFQVQ